MQSEESLCNNLEILFVDTLILYQAVLRKSILGKAYQSIGTYSYLFFWDAQMCWAV